MSAASNGGRVLRGDCRDVLPTLAESCVDVVVTDPPYGITSLTWDVPVEGWLPEVDRVLKPSGSLWVFGSMRSLAPMIADTQRGLLGDWRYAQEVVWEKHNGSGFQADRFRRVHEFAAHFYRGPWSSVYRDPVYTMDAKARVVRSKRRPKHMGQIDRTPYISHDGGPRLQRSVLRVRSEHGRADHPTQKPTGILRPLIEYSCPPGGTVLDPFAGSGSTGVAAHELGREAVLIEVDADYFAVAERRVQQLPMVVSA